jgi:hypothetical protein
MRELAEAAVAIVAGSSAPTPASKASIERKKFAKLEIGISVNIDPGIRAGGAIALFVLVYLVNPPELVAARNPPPEQQPPNPGPEEGIVIRVIPNREGIDTLVEYVIDFGIDRAVPFENDLLHLLLDAISA